MVPAEMVTLILQSVVRGLWLQSGTTLQDHPPCSNSSSKTVTTAVSSFPKELQNLFVVKNIPIFRILFFLVKGFITFFPSIFKM